MSPGQVLDKCCADKCHGENLSPQTGHIWLSSAEVAGTLSLCGGGVYKVIVVKLSWGFDN